MDLLALILDFILHVDVHLQSLMNNYGLWVYAILFLIIFCETGLVVTPFLPGDSLLFGAQSDLARDAAARLDRRAARLARQVLAVDRYGLMERFVGDYVRENPADGEMEGSNTTLAWIEFLRANGIEHAYATGSIAEVLADVNDRVSGQTQQLANSVGWSKDLIAMQLQQDSMRLEVGARLDSLERNFTRIVVVAEHLPEISDKVLEELNKQVTQLIYTMNYSLDNAFANFDRQRDELQRYVTAERQALVDQLRETDDGRTLVRRILGMVARNEYKRRQAAPIIRVRSRAFGSGRQLPIAAHYPTGDDA